MVHTSFMTVSCPVLVTLCHKDRHTKKLKTLPKIPELINSTLKYYSTVVVTLNNHSVPVNS